MTHGVMKFRKRLKLDKKWLEEFGFPVGSVTLNGVIQVSGGLVICIGLFSSYAAAILVLNLLVASYVSIWKQNQPFLSTSEGKGWDINFLLIGALVVLMFLGDGKWSVSQWLM